MKTIIAGSRSINDSYLLAKAIEASGFKITEVVYGGARGADTLGKQWAKAQNPPIPVIPFEAAWSILGRKAGPIRNQKMTDYANCAIVLWDGKSDGTADLLKRLRKANIPLHLTMTRHTL